MRPADAEAQPSSAQRGATSVSHELGRWGIERRIFLHAAAVALPGLTAAIIILWLQPTVALGLLAIGSAVILTVLLLVRVVRQVAYPIYTLTNLLEAVREGDYSVRGARTDATNLLGLIVREVNALSESLREHRLAAEERGALLTKVLAAFDIAIFTFDNQGRLQLLNPAAQRLLTLDSQAGEEHTVQSLQLADYLAFDGTRVITREFAGRDGRWQVTHTRFRERGVPHDLLVITDLNPALRQEERLMWQRLLRVLSHELNNSLAPIRSTAATTITLLDSPTPLADWRDDARECLRVIEQRCDALARFLGRYAQLARLPAPSRRTAEVGELVRRSARLETRLPVRVVDGPAVHALLDPDQIEQTLINLIRNAVDAATTTQGQVEVRWHSTADAILIEVLDEGCGLPRTDNLFVPFFTTKPGGSGIGLVLARQIAEGHGGMLTLRNREDAPGCIAQLQLPLLQPGQQANNSQQ